MKLKIRKIGGSLGFIIPKSILYDMNAQEGDLVEMEPIGNHSYHLSPARERSEELTWDEVKDIFEMDPDERFLRDTEMPGVVADPWADAREVPRS